MRTAKTILAMAVLGWTGSLAAGQVTEPWNVQAFLKQDQAIVGVGAVRSMPYVAINNARLWSARIGTDFADNTRDFVVLRNGFVTLREGMTIFNPAGYTLDEWNSISFSSNGDFGMLLKIANPTEFKEGVFWNLSPVVLGGDPIVSPLLGPGSVYDKFKVIKMNGNNLMYVLASINNTAVGSGTSKEDALIRLQLDSHGALVSTTVLATKDMPLPQLGSGIKVTTLATTEHGMDMNLQGDVIVLVSAGPGQGKTAVWLNMDTILAQELQNTPVPGVKWRGLSGTKVALNDVGGYVLTGNTDAPESFLIVKDGEKFVQQGDILPQFSAAPLQANGLSPVVLTDHDDVFWVARFAGVTDDAFARNFEPIVQRNVTTIEGNLIVGIIADENAFSVSPNGRFFIGRVDIQSVGFSLVFIDFGLVEPMPGCAGNQGELKLASGRPLVGNQMVLSLDNGQAPGVIPTIAFATRPATANNCGIPTPFGDVMISPGDTQVIQLLPPWDGVNPVQLTLNVPSNIALVDAVFYAQAAFRDPRRPSTEKYRLTNALRFELGPP